jgi:hypothetical protein
MMLSGVVASCTRDSACTQYSLGSKAKPSKNRKHVRKVLRKDYHHHQTRVGKFFNINIF